MTGTGLAAVRLRHRALPERDLAGVSLATELLGCRLSAPLVISAMTGGTGGVGADQCGFARRGGRPRHRPGARLGPPGCSTIRRCWDTYRPDAAARPPLLLANLGRRPDPRRRRRPGAERLVELLGADALSIHLNPIQEAIQPEGEADFSRVLEGIRAVVARLAPVPVVVKEVGFGLDAEDVRALAGVGVAAIDVAGAGGTNWASIEGRRDPRAGAVAAAFEDWGVPTATALAEAADAAPECR